MAGRPKIEIDVARVAELAGRGLTQTEICAVLGISDQTLLNRKRENLEFLEAMKQGRAKAAEDVANALYTKATVDKDLGAIIWFEKTRRGLSDRTTTTTTTIQIDWEKVDPATRDAFIEGRITLDDILRRL